jgi:hypothetical protein
MPTKVGFVTRSSTQNDKTADKGTDEVVAVK